VNTWAKAQAMKKKQADEISINALLPALQTSK
jgi:hypothetical protein